MKISKEKEEGEEEEEEWDEVRGEVRGEAEGGEEASCGGEVIQVRWRDKQVRGESGELMRQVTRSEGEPPESLR